MKNEGIVLKVKDLNEAAFHAVIRKLAQCSAYPTFGTTFMISKLCKQIMKDTQEMNSTYRKSFDGLINEDGSPKETRKEEYEEKLKEFMETEIALSSDAGQFKKIPVHSLAKVGLSPADLAILEPLIDTTSAPLEVL